MYIKDLLSQILEKAIVLGLDEYDSSNAKDFLANHEFELCLDTIVTQVYEYEIKIDNKFYDLVLDTSNKMKLKPERYNYLNSTIYGIH